MKMSNKRLYTFTEVKISESASFIIEIYYLLGCFPLIYPKSISDRLSQLKTIMSYKCICVFLIFQYVTSVSDDNRLKRFVSLYY